MNARQLKFVQEFVKTGCATQAMIEAGYSKKYAGQNADRLLKNPGVQKAIKELQESVRTSDILDARQMQEALTAIILQQSEEEVVVVEGIGEGQSVAVTKKKKPSQADRIKAVQLLARMQGVLDADTKVSVVLPVFGGEKDLKD